jgi:hypothetical protein
MCVDYFFPTNSLAAQPERHESRVAWYAPFLVVMKEGPLYPPAVDRPPTYRLLHLPTFKHPSVVYLAEVSGAWHAVCKRNDGRGGYSPGRLVATSERDLTRAESKQLGRLLNRVGFWDMPSYEECYGLDGTQCVLEGVLAGRYHVVDRWSPHGTPYARLIEFLLGLCPVFDDSPPPKYLNSFAELEQHMRPEPEERDSD